MINDAAYGRITRSFKTDKVCRFECIQKNLSRAREIVQLLRTGTALVDDWDSVSSTHMAARNHISFHFQGSLLISVGSRTHVVHMHTLRCTRGHIEKEEELYRKIARFQLLKTCLEKQLSIYDNFPIREQNSQGQNTI